jgi:predicted aspartyl protease
MFSAYRHQIIIVNGLILSLLISFFLLPNYLLANEISANNPNTLPTIEEILTKVFLAYGGKEALYQNEKNCILVGQQKIIDLNTQISKTARFRKMRKNTNIRIDMEIPDDQSTTTAYDGITAWKSVNNIVSELSPEFSKLLKQEIDREPCALTHFQEPSYIFQFLGKTTFAANNCFAIELSKPSESPTTFFIDEKNYLVIGTSYTSIDPPTQTPNKITVEYTQYRPVNGTLFPYRLIQFINNQPAFDTTIETVDFNSTIENHAFQRPDRPYVVRLAKPVSIPFDYSAKAILVKARINGSEFRDFLVDTGASHTIIDRRVAAEHFLDRQGNFNVTTIAGMVSTQTTYLRSLEIGEVNLEKVQALILDLSAQSRQLGKPIAGIIGNNVLSQFALTINFAKSNLVVTDSNSYKPPQGAATISFIQKQGPIVKAVLNGKEEFPFLIDTGAAFNNLPTKTAKHFISGEIGYLTEGTGLDGSKVRLATVNIDSLKLGNLISRQVPFTYSIDQDLRQNSVGFFQTANTGVLGNPFWQNFTLTLDYRLKRLVLQSNKTLSTKQELNELIEQGDSKLIVYRDCRTAEIAYQKALMRAQTLGDLKQQARIWGRLGNLRRVMAKDLNRPEQARIAYEYFSKAQELAHKLEDREIEGRILADWSLLYLDNGQLPAARQALEGAILYAPQDPQVNIDFANYLYRLRFFSDMQRYVDKTLFLDPKNWQALWYKVKLAEMFNDNNELKRALKEILTYYPWSKLAQTKLNNLISPPLNPGADKVQDIPGLQ